MAGPVPTYLTTQQGAQTAFTVPFGLLTLVNSKIAAAIAAGEFNTTVDCSLFVTEDVSNLRIYLDSLGYDVDFAKNTNEKSLNIDWGRFRDTPGTAVTVFQGTVPWIVAGTVTADQGAPGTTPWPVTGTITTSPDVNVHDGSGNAISSTGTSLDVNVTDFPATVAVTQSTSPWVISGNVAITNFPAVQPVSGTITALQGTSPWVVSGTITTSPNVNVHDGSGNSISSTGTSLDVNVTDFPAVQPVSGTVTALQGTSPWVVSGTVAATQSGVWTTGRTWALTSGTDSVSAVQSGVWTVQQGTPPWSVSVTNFPATQPVSGTVTVLQGTSPWVVSGTVAATQSGTWTTGRTWALSSGTDSVTVAGTVAVTQSTSPWVVSGTVTANAGTGNFTVVQPTGTNLHVTVDNFPATQPISAVSLPLPTGAATSANQTNASQKTQIVDGSGNVIASTTNALNVDVINFPATQAVTQSFGSEVAYSFAGGVTMGLLATDVFTINGSNTKIIRILEIELFLERTTVGAVPVTLIRRSTSNTGGTSATFGAIAQDPNDPTSSGNVTLYTANPATLGTSPGNVGVTYLNGSAATTPTQNGWKIEFLYDGFGKGVVLRNANQHIACNFGGVTVAGGILLMNITWVEE